MLLSAIPGIGEAMDATVITDSKSDTTDKLAAGVSLGIAALGAVRQARSLLKATEASETAINRAIRAYEKEKALGRIKNPLPTAAIRDAYKKIFTRYHMEKEVLRAEGRFARFEANEVYRDVNIGVLRGSRKVDFAAADRAAGITEAYRVNNGFVWHHHEDLGRMQLVKIFRHEQIERNHAGGVAVWERMLGLPSGSYR
jgi:HNH/ENDO VII superfamily nuclease